MIKRASLCWLISTLALAASAGADPLAEKINPPARLFPLSDVRLTDPNLLKIRELDHQYLLALDSERLLRNFRENVGIKTGIEPLLGHEAPNDSCRGHYTGHYLSACAMMVASTGDAKLKAKADAIVAELAKLQQPDGYLGALPETQFDNLEAGKKVGVPWYTEHKIMAGLLDMALYTGNQQALDVVQKIGDWVDARTKKLDHATMQRVLGTEFGGMGEIMANLAAVTGKESYLQVAKRFDHESVLKPAEAGEDKLAVHHANTMIPKFVSAAREYELTGDESYRKAATFFWQQVALHRSYATGGNSVREAFRTPPDVLSGTLEPCTQESCNTYNMLRLTEHLFAWNPSASYGDYYERALLNHILATPHPETGMPLYYLGLMPGQWKAVFEPNMTFWCCAGTGLENFTKLQRGIYFHGDGQIWVNLFFASEVDWKEKGVSIRQETKFPNEPGTTLHIQAKKPTAFKLNIRIPYWADGSSISVNGQPQQLPLNPGTFAMIDRTWNDGDQVSVRLPMRLHLQPMPDDPKIAAIMYGPVVLAGELGPVPKDQVQSRHYNASGLFNKNPYPDADQLALVGTSNKLEDWIEPIAGKLLTFKTKGVGRPSDFVLSPFYRLFDQRYNVYWKLEPNPQ